MNAMLELIRLLGVGWCVVGSNLAPANRPQEPSIIVWRHIICPISTPVTISTAIFPANCIHLMSSVPQNIGSESIAIHLVSQTLIWSKPLGVGGAGGVGEKKSKGAEAETDDDGGTGPFSPSCFYVKRWTAVPNDVPKIRRLGVKSEYEGRWLSFSELGTTTGDDHSKSVRADIRTVACSNRQRQGLKKKNKHKVVLAEKWYQV